MTGTVKFLATFVLCPATLATERLVMYLGLFLSDIENDTIEAESVSTTGILRKSNLEPVVLGARSDVTSPVELIGIHRDHFVIALDTMHPFRKLDRLDKRVQAWKQGYQNS